MKISSNLLAFSKDTNFIFFEQEEQEEEEGCDEPAAEEVDKGGKFSESIFNSRFSPFPKNPYQITNLKSFILDLTEAGTYPQLPTQPKNFFYPFQTYTAI